MVTNSKVPTSAENRTPAAHTSLTTYGQSRRPSLQSTVNSAHLSVSSWWSYCYCYWCERVRLLSVELRPLTVEWQWQGKTKELGEKPVTVPLRPPEIPHALPWVRTHAAVVRSRRLTTWAMARPMVKLSTVCWLRVVSVASVKLWSGQVLIAPRRNAVHMRTLR
jgi:hypothetical protein